MKDAGTNDNRTRRQNEREKGKREINKDGNEEESKRCRNKE